MHHCRRAVVAGLAAWLSVSTWAGESAHDFSKLAPIALHPALVEAARTNHIPIEQVDAPTNTGKLNPGDSVTILLNLRQKGAPAAQWLLYLEAVAPSPKDKPAKPKPPMVLYASTGQKMEFTSSPAWVELRTLGPFADGTGKQKPPLARNEHSRFTLDKDFLALGMDRAAAAIIRLNHSREASKTNAPFAISDEPPAPDRARQGKEWAELMHLTVEEQRAIAGAGPSMMSYFEVVQQTPDLEQMLLKVADLPSVWSVVGHLGVKTDLEIDSKHFALAEPETWALPTRPPVYYLPMEFRLNNRRGLSIALAVTTPYPPLLACGGIVGILAEKPSEKETYLTLRLISARFNRPPWLLN